MNVKWRQRIAVVLAFIMLAGTVWNFSWMESIQTYAAAEASEQADLQKVQSRQTLCPDMEKNLNYQNYTVNGGMVSSYLVLRDNGYMRVQHVEENEAPVVEYYNEQFQLQSQMYVEKELEDFAGFYAGSEYYYIAWVQAVPLGNWSDQKAFMRVTKYDKNWNRLAHADICSADFKNEMGVVYPCDAGSLRMSEYQGHLYINTCYEGIDLHQRSAVFDLIEETMTFVNLEINSVAAFYGRTSHSFNQYLLIDEALEPKRLVTLNQGDNPDGGKRGAVLEQCVLYANYPTAVQMEDKKLVNTLEAAGGNYSENGNVNNYVGMSLGGLEQSQTSYLMAGNSIEQAEETFLKAKQRNIFVTATSRTNFTKENTNITWLTNYKEGDGVEISTPQFVKMNDNLFLVMWRVGEQADHIAGELHYTFVDGDGNRCAGTLGQTRTAEAEITDCKPVVKDGKAVWYSSGEEGVYFYSIDCQGAFEKHGVNTIEEIPVLKNVELQKDGIYFEWEPVEHAQGYRIIRRYATGFQMDKYEYAVCDVEGGQTCEYLDDNSFVDCRPYDFFICALDENGVSGYGSNIINKWIYKGIEDYLVSVENVDEGVKVNWSAKPDVEFRIYRSSADSTDDTLIATINGPADKDYTLGDKQSYIDRTAVRGAAYDYSVSVYSQAHESERFNKQSIIYLSKPEISADCTVDNDWNTITLSWDEIPRVKEYSVETYVWDDASGKYQTTNMGKGYSEDNLSCVVYGASEGKKYKFTVVAVSEIIQTSSMSRPHGFLSPVASTELTYVRPETPPTPTPNPALSPSPSPSSAPIVELKTPAFTSMQNTSEGVQLKWNAIEGADGYEVNAFDTSQGSRTVIISATGCVDAKAVEGKTCYYKVRAYAQIGQMKLYSAWSVQSGILFQKPTSTSTPTAKPTSTPAAKPTSKPTSVPEVKLSAPNLYSAENLVDGVNFKWSKVEGADGYHVYYYDEEHLESKAKADRSILEFLYETAEEGKTYCCYVVAWAVQNGNLYLSEPSKTVKIQYKNPSAAASLKPPVLTKLSCLVDGAVLVEWEPVSGANGYKVYSYNATEPQYIRQVATLKGEKQNHCVQDYTLNSAEGSTVCFFVRAYKQTDQGGQSLDCGRKSNEKEIVIQRTHVNLTSVKNTFYGVEVKWKPISGVDGYEICYHKKDSNSVFTQKAKGSDTSVFVDKYSENGESYYFYVVPYVEYEGRLRTGKESEKALITVSKMTVEPTPSSSPTGQVTPPPGSTGQVTPPGSTGQATPPPGSTGQVTPPPGSTGQATPPPGSTGQVTPPPGLAGQVTPPPGLTGQVTPPPGSTGQVTPPPGSTGQVTPPSSKGDVNGDGEIRLEDAQMALRAALSIIELTDKQKMAADLNENGTVELDEVQMILRAALGIISL